MTNESKAIAKAEVNSISVNPNFNVPEGYICTFDISTDDGKLQVLSALNGAVPLKDEVGTILQVCDCVTEPGIRKARAANQEDSQCTNVYITTVEGVTYFSQSEGVARSVKMIAALWPDFGKSTDLGYINVSCIEKQLANGNTIKSIVPASV